MTLVLQKSTPYALNSCILHTKNSIIINMETVNTDVITRQNSICKQN